MDKVKLIYLGVLSIILSLLNFGCTKDSINGDLDGRWQIMEIVPLYEGSLKDKQLYYNFYLHVCNLSYYGGVLTEGNFVYENNKITLDFPYIQTIIGHEKLSEYGIMSNPVTFEILHLSKNKLILQDGEITITLRKF